MNNVLAALALAVIASCAAPASPTTTNINKTYVVEAKITLGVTGAQTVAFKGKTYFTVAEIIGPKFPKAAWFLNGGTPLPIDLGDGRRVRVSFDLLPGSWHGDDTYTLDETKATVQGIQSGLTAHAEFDVIYVTGARQGTVASFNKIAKPCTIEVHQAATAAHLKCPNLQAVDGTSVVLDANWTGKRVPPPNLTPAPVPTASATP